MKMQIKTNEQGEIQFAQIDSNDSLLRFELSETSNTKLMKFFDNNAEIFRMTCFPGLCDHLPDLPMCWLEIQMESGDWKQRRRVTPLGVMEFEVEFQNGRETTIERYNPLKPRKESQPSCSESLPKTLEKKLEPFLPVLGRLNEYYEKRATEEACISYAGVFTSGDGGGTQAIDWRKWARAGCWAAAGVGTALCCGGTALVGCALCGGGFGGAASICSDGFS